MAKWNFVLSLALACGRLDGVMSLSPEILSPASDDIFQIKTKAPGPAGSLPLTEEFLRQRPSGDIFGLTQNAGMGWAPSEAGGRPFLRCPCAPGSSGSRRATRVFPR